MSARRGNLLDTALLRPPRQINSMLDFAELGSENSAQNQPQIANVTSSVRLLPNTSSIAANNESVAPSSQRLSRMTSRNDAFLFSLQNEPQNTTPTRKSRLLARDNMETPDFQQKPEITQPIPQVSSNPQPSSDRNAQPIQLPQKNLFADELTPILKQKSPEIILQPTDNFEASFVTLLDRTLNNFKRSVARDVSASFRCASVRENQIFDSFADSMIREIEQTIQSQQYYSIDPSTAAKKISLSIDENTNQIRNVFHECETQEINKREKKQELFADYGSALADLSKAFNETSSSFLSSLEKFNSQLCIQHETIESQRRKNSRQIRILKIKAADFESRLSRQKIEQDSLDQMMKQMEIQNNDETKQKVSIKPRTQEIILEEIDRIQQALDSNSIADFEDICFRVRQKMSDFSTKLMEDFGEIEYLERNAIMCIKNAPPRMKMISTHSFSKSQSNEKKAQSSKPNSPILIFPD